MIQPYIDCALRLRAKRRRADDVRAILCETAKASCTGCGSRWPPSSGRRTAMRPSSRRPIASPHAIVHGRVGLEPFTDRPFAIPQVLALAAKVGFVVDPANPYPPL